jgi:pimeloyl-ACP methyl ester carboxylesterase
MDDYQIFRLGDVKLQAGVVCPDAFLAYKTFGALNPAKSNAIIYPTPFGAQHRDIEWLIRRGLALDPNRYFIVIPNMFGNGLSTSPNNFPDADRGAYPHFLYDNVVLQQGVVREGFGIERLALAVGFSMGGQQAFHWAALFPEMVERLAVICGSAKTSRHNFVFLEGVKAALTADPNWRDGWFAEPPQRGLRAMGRIYAGWALSQAFYREELFAACGIHHSKSFWWTAGTTTSCGAMPTISSPCCGPGSTPTSAPTGSAQSVISPPAVVTAMSGRRGPASTSATAAPPAMRQRPAAPGHRRSAVQQSGARPAARPASFRPAPKPPDDPSG